MAALRSSLQAPAAVVEHVRCPFVVALDQQAARFLDALGDGVHR